VRSLAVTARQPEPAGPGANRIAEVFGFFESWPDRGHYFRNLPTW
jgi:hypothetical protein